MSQGQGIRKTASLVMLLLLGALVLPLAGRGGETAPPADDCVRMAYAVSMFGEVDLQDAKLAMETWTQELCRLMNMKAHVEVFATLGEAEALVKKREADMLVIDALDYLHMKGQGELEPLLVGMANGQVGYEFILVVNRASGISQLQQLKGKSIIIQGDRGADAIRRLWLDTQLREHGLADGKAFFGRIKPAKKSSQAVLPVFFNQADAAVVTRDAYDTMVELNPQIGKSLEIIAHSPRYVQSMMVIRKALPASFKEKIVEAALKVNSYPRGNQIFNLFRTGGITRWHAEYLKTLQELALKPH